MRPAAIGRIGRTPRTRIVGVVIAALLLLLSGCSTISGGVYDAPLPGGADVGDDPITLTAEFDDVLDLVPQSSVKVDNVAVGRVTEIDLSDDGHSATVELLVRNDIDLPAGTTARLQQTSLLGEKYVALIRPSGDVVAEQAMLADGDSLDRDHTDAAAEVEQVLGALSLVLNGGGIGRFQEISRELQAIGDGRTEGVREFLEQMHRFVKVLDQRRGSITTAIDGLAELAGTLDEDKQQIADVLDGLAPGMQVLVDQRPQLVRMLEALDRLSTITVRTLDSAQDDMVADFELLAPILRELADAGDDLPRSLEILLTYPFPDAVLDAISGDYLNVFLTTNFRTLPAGCTKMGCSWPQVGSRSVDGRRATPPRSSESPSPTMLPPTDSPIPGSPTPTVTGPTIVPTDPTEPTDSTDPTADPTDPADPSDSDGPSDTSDPSDPGDPGDPVDSPNTPTRGGGPEDGAS